MTKASMAGDIQPRQALPIEAQEAAPRGSALRRVLQSGGGVVAACALLFMLLYFYQGDAGLNLGSSWLIFALFAVSVDFLWGYTGVLSVGQGVFFGLGGYCYAWMTVPIVFDAPVTSNASLLGCLAAVLVPGLVALLVGVLSFHGGFGANIWVFTLALGLLATMLGYSATGVFGGFGGINLIPPLSLTIGDWTGTVGWGVPVYLTVACVLVLVVMALRWVLTSDVGLLMASIRDNEERSQYLGTNVNLVKLAVFVVSSMVAGLAGALCAGVNSTISPDVMGFGLSLSVILWVMIGGRGTLFGGVVGCLAMMLLQWQMSGSLAGFYQLVVGGLLIVIVLTRSGGVVPFTVHLLGNMADWIRPDGRRGTAR